MRATNLATAIDTAYRINRPMMLWGPPGCGKTALFKDAAARLNVPMIDWPLVLMDPVDMRGTPDQDRKERVTRWLPPEELPTDGEGILFLDELPQAKADTKNVAARLVLERRIGDYRLPPGWRIMAAGNRAQDASSATPLPKHLDNRFWHQEFTLSVEDWLAWAEAHDIDYRCYAYIKYRSDALLDFDPRSKDPAFASPRSWELCSDLIKDLDKNGDMMTSIDIDVRADYFSGAVGRGRGMEFSGFLQVMDSLVTTDEVFATPGTAAISKDPAVCYALVCALATAAKRDTVDAMLTYVGRLPDEFAMVAIYAIEKRNPLLMKSKSYIALCAKHQGKL